MCEHCESENPWYCQNCGCQICEDIVGGGDDVIAAPYVTSYGDLYCWHCGIREQNAIEAQENEEAEEWRWMDDRP